MNTPIFTPHGLKLRINEDDIIRVFGNAYSEFDLDKVGIDVELWEAFPKHLSVITVILVAFISRNTLYTILALVIGYLIGSIVQNFSYSKILSNVVSLILGHPIVSLIITTANGLYLYLVHDSLGVAIIQAVLTLLSILSISSTILELLMMPIRVIARRVNDIGGLELAYLKIINKQAEKLGYSLDWSKASS